MQTATRDTPVDPLVGRTLEGRYRILSRLARGGMSVVYEAVDTRLDRLVAVKVMSAALSADPAFSDRFSREARAAARLSHLNAVAVYDQGEDDDTGLVFLVMELVDGRTLRELIREHGRFSPAEAVSIMEPVLSALAAAHRAGIVHRDVKPENILLSDDGVVKVADFGLARAIESDPESTRTGLMMGTVAYCSPEQISKGQGDQRSDVYSSGIVLFELLTGMPPFSGESAMNIAYQHVHSRVPAPSSLAPGIPSELDELVITATDSDPTGRLEDVAEFLAELADLRAKLGLPVVAIAPRERIPYRNQTPPPAAQPVAQPLAQQSTDVLGMPAQPQTRPAGAATPAPPVRPRGVQHTAEMRGPMVPPPPVVIPPKRPGKMPRMSRRRARRRGLVVLLVILALGLAAGGTGWWFASGRYSRVPELSGETQARATEAIKGSGYKLGAPTTDFSHAVPKGSVITSKPGSGTRLERGRAISLVVSAGKDMVAVPRLDLGAGKQKIESTLSAAGLDVKYADPVFSDTVSTDHLVTMDPAAGKPLERGYSTVTVTLSKGPDWVSVPVISSGASYKDASDAIKAAGLTAAKNEQYSDSVPKDQVILPLNPADRQRRGQTVTVTVSKGPEFVTIPDIPQGSDVNAAKAALEALGLKVKIDKQYGGVFGGNQVYSVDPGPGQQVHPGDKVTISAI